MASRRPIYRPTFQLTGYAAESNENNIFAIFQDNKVLLPTGHDVIASPQPGSAARSFFMTDSERATMIS